MLSKALLLIKQVKGIRKKINYIHIYTINQSQRKRGIFLIKSLQTIYISLLYKDSQEVVFREIHFTQYSKNKQPTQNSSPSLPPTHKSKTQGSTNQIKTYFERLVSLSFIKRNAM